MYYTLPMTEQLSTETSSPKILVVLGKNIGVNSTRSDIQNDNFHLSTDSRLNVLAAGELCKPGMKIIFSTGKTAGNDFPSEAEAMRKYFRIHFPDFPEKNLVLGPNSKDTAGNAQEVAKILSTIPNSEVE